MPVEFIDDAEDAEDGADELRAPQRRPALYRFAAAAAVLIAVIAWALTRPADNTTPSASKPSTSPTTVPTTLVPSSTPSTLGTDILVCQTDAPVMIPIASAMKRYLPGLDLAGLTAYRCTRGGGMGGQVVSEGISGRYHRLRIDVEATLRTEVDASIASPPEGSRVLVARIEALAAGLKVDVSAWGRRGGRAPIDAMRSLADFVSLNVVL
jgi:hypothetical protein